jgi:4-amino-4-deoxy-L-arabinose transferase-like glycosyltransferase
MVRRIQLTIRSHPWAALMVALYLGLGLAFSIINPIHEATDELRHYRYVRYLADFGELPVQSGEAGNAQAHHPPLYYATAALASFWVHPDDPLADPPGNPHWGYRNWEVGTDNKNLYLHGPDERWPYRGEALAAHLARWVTLLWGAGAVILTYASAATLFPTRKAVAGAAAALVALNPMFLYLGGAVNNDVPAGLIGAAITYLCLRTVRDGPTPRRTLALGVWYGLASLVKFNLVAMLAVIEIALALALWATDRDSADRKPWLAFLRANGIILGLTALLAGWWYARNTILYGEPTGFLRLTEIWGVRDPREGVTLAGSELRYAWTSLWGRFGYGQIPLPDGWYIAIGALCGLGLAGLIVYLIRARGSLRSADWQMIGVLAAAVLINFGVLYAYITVSPAGAMGRFFFPGLPAFAALIAAGLIGLWPPKIQPWAAGIVSAGMLAFALVALIGYLAPAYAPPAQASLPDDPANVDVGDAARILAYEVTPDSIRSGEAISVTVTWEVLQPTEVPYTVFIHIFGKHGALVAQRDTYPGLGNYPTTWWEPGHVFSETYRVYVPETTIEPNRLEVWLGLAHPDLGRLPIDSPDAVDDALPVGSVVLEADPDAEYPNQTFVNWEDKFALVGYYIEPYQTYPGRRLYITLYWQALDPPPDEDFRVFLHVLKGWSNVAGLDGAPVNPATRTREWEPGEVFEEERRIVLPSDIPPGLYELELGWFSAETGDRLNVIGEEGQIVDNRLILSTVQILPREENPDG